MVMVDGLQKGLPRVKGHEAGIDAAKLSIEL